MTYRITIKLHLQVGSFNFSILLRHRPSSHTELYETLELALRHLLSGLGYSTALLPIETTCRFVDCKQRSTNKMTNTPISSMVRSRYISINDMAEMSKRNIGFNVVSYSRHPPCSSNAPLEKSISSHPVNMYSKVALCTWDYKGRT